MGSPRAQKSGTIRAARLIQRTLILCEGVEDKSFLRALCITNGAPYYWIEEADGRDKFRLVLSRIYLEKTDNWQNLRDVVLIADNDDDPDGNFRNICKQVEEFTQGTAPTRPQLRTGSSPSYSIFMIPKPGVKGNLECLCAESAHHASKKKGHLVNDILAMAGGDSWGPSRYGKAWLRSNLAIRCEDPFVTLRTIFAKKRYRKLIPIRGNAPLTSALLIYLTTTLPVA
jgi:hypothetical protein